MTKQTYEAWRISHQSSEGAAKAAWQALQLEREKWLYYQELIKLHGHESITELLVANWKLKAKIARFEFAMKTKDAALETAVNGITWYMENSTESNGCDDDALNEIKQALATQQLTDDTIAAALICDFKLLTVCVIPPIFKDKPTNS